MSLINVNNLTFGYEGSITNVFENVSFNIDTDWKLSLIGRNGKGKTTFLKLLLGKYEYKGTISKNVEFDYFPFEIENKEKMAIEAVHEIAPNVEDWEIIKELNLLNRNAEILYRNFNILSGGEQVKILLISLFLKGNNFLLIDEPTNHLDNETRENLVEYLNKKKGFILVSHDRTFLDTENLKGTLKEFAKSNKVDESIFKAMLSKMGFTNLDFETDIRKMSEGQKKKVLIAKSISEPANLYIWDEPLNYIDILTRIQIEEAILKYKPTIIFIEHDETFIKNVATKVIRLENIR